MTNTLTRSDRILGSLVGAALGDAMAAPLEFRGFAHIMSRYPDRSAIPPGRLVTDDTQMMLAVGEALVASRGRFDAPTLERELRRTFLDWYRSPDNTRAPGITCMSACARLAQGMPWVEATAADSKGCGANMRVTPVGLLVSADAGTRSAIAQFQAALTHGHPTGLIAADLTAEATHLLVNGTDTSELIPRLESHLHDRSGIYNASWLGDLWKRPGVESPEAFLARGVRECAKCLESIKTAAAKRDLSSDPCGSTGDGWIAEEAFATGLLCFLLYHHDPVAAIRHASATGGDSDSIACLTGAFAGAAHGISAWPADWVAAIEYHNRLMALGNSLSQL